MKVEEIKVGDYAFGFVNRPVTALTRTLRVTSITMTDRYVTMHLLTFGRKRYERGSTVPFREVYRLGKVIFSQDGKS